jgi:hypothetical protein
MNTVSRTQGYAITTAPGAARGGSLRLAPMAHCDFQGRESGI